MGCTMRFSSGGQFSSSSASSERSVLAISTCSNCRSQAFPRRTAELWRDGEDASGRIWKLVWFSDFCRNLGFLQKEKLIQYHPIKESVPVLCLNTSNHGKAQDELWRKVNDPWTVDHPKQDPWKGCVVIRSVFGSRLLLLKDCILPAGEFSNCVLTEYYLIPSGYLT